MNECCKNCRFYRDETPPEALERPEEWGCTHYFRTCRVRSVPHTNFPSRKETDWCGEWEPESEYEPLVPPK